MIDNIAFLRCNKCRTVNRVPADKLKNYPKCGKCKTLLEIPVRSIDITASNFDPEVLAWPGFVLVEFWAPWCGHCRMIAPVVDELAREKAGLLKVVKVNVDNEPSLGARFSVKATPMFFIFRNGTKLSEMTGALSKQHLEAWIDSSLLEQ
jgi:thioredoxin 2